MLPSSSLLPPLPPPAPHYKSRGTFFSELYLSLALVAEAGRPHERGCLPSSLLPQPGGQKSREGFTQTYYWPCGLFCLNLKSTLCSHRGPCNKYSALARGRQISPLRLRGRLLKFKRPKMGGGGGEAPPEKERLKWLRKKSRRNGGTGFRA